MNRFFNTPLLLFLALVCMCTAVKFNATHDAITLYEAIYAKKADNITEVLTRRSAEQRLEIAKAYKDKFSRLDNEFGYISTIQYRDLMVALVTPLSEYNAKKLVSDPDSIVDIFTTLSNGALKAVDDADKRLRRNAKSNLQEFVLEKKLLTDRVIGGALKGLRNEAQKVDGNAARADAKVIHDIGEGKNGWTRNSTEEQTVENIFITRSYRQLSRICEEYKTLYGHGIEKAFEGREWCPAMERSFLKMIDVFKSIPNYYAELLYKSLGKSNTDSTVIRIIVGRSTCDLSNIIVAFHNIFGDSLASRIEKYTSGPYQTALLAIVNSENKHI